MIPSSNFARGVADLEIDLAPVRLPQVSGETSPLAISAWRWWMQKLGDVLLNLLMLVEQPESPASGFRRCASKPPVSLRHLSLFPPLHFGQAGPNH
jgi:hypothetical protein